MYVSKVRNIAGDGGSIKFLDSAFSMSVGWNLLNVLVAASIPMSQSIDG